MITLAIRTDKPVAELYLLRDAEIQARIEWEAHRELGVSLHQKVQQILESQKVPLQALEKIAVFEGPGSFTGLRIGISVANSLGYALGIPVVAAGGENWLEVCIDVAVQGTHRYARPVYGSDPHITQQKK